MRSRQLGFPLYVNGRLYNEPVTISHVPGMGAVDPSMGALGELVSYRPTPGLGAPVAPEPVLAPVETTYQSPVARVLASPIYRLVSLASTAGLAFHGYRRNESVGWAIGWALLGGIAPIIAWPVALAQGFGKPRRNLTPNRSRSRRRKQRKNSASGRDDRRYVEIAPETVEMMESGEYRDSDFDFDHESFREIVGRYQDYDEEIERLGVGRFIEMPDGWRVKRVK
jgi:hypothetical protein